MSTQPSQYGRYGKSALVCSILLFIPIVTQAANLSLSYHCITNNDTTGDNCSTGENQLYTEVTDIGVNDSGVSRVQFDFFNTGPTGSLISEVYFDDGTLLGIAEIIDADTGGNTDVNFSQDANPPKLPGWNKIDPNFEVTAGFLADADNPAPKWGVAPGEQLGIIFNLKDGGTYENIAAELADGRLRVGMHVISTGATGGNESFVSKPVPLPAAAWLFLSGLLGITMKKRQTKQPL
mgnify:CR=1 FL=1